MACAGSTKDVVSVTPELDVPASWALKESVAVRPERFGALLYDFETRRLTFVKDPKLVNLLKQLREHATIRQACIAAGIPEAKHRGYLKALARLEQTNMISNSLKGH